jgi:aspartate oxidase
MGYGENGHSSRRVIKETAEPTAKAAIDRLTASLRRDDVTVLERRRTRPAAQRPKAKRSGSTRTRLR